MIKSWKCNLKHLTSKEYEYLRKLCHLSKNVYNEALYNVRQHYFKTKEHLSYEANYHIIKNSYNYKLLGINASQQAAMNVEHDYQSYFALMKLAKEGKYDITKVHLPHYLEKDEFREVRFSDIKNAKLQNGNEYKIPMSNLYKKEFGRFDMFIKIPDFLLDKTIQQIRISPRCNGRYFEVIFIYEDEAPSKQELDSTKALAIDLGVSNLMTCATSEGKSFIIDGKKLKSINQWFNKNQARLSSIKDKQQLEVKQTKRQARLSLKRQRRIQDYIYKSSKYVINYCLRNNIGNLVFGYNQDFQDSTKLGKKGNQNFVNIPFGKLKQRLKYLCEINGIKFVEQEESYTSKASFWDKDFIPVYDPESTQIHQFSGRRTYRGQYKTSSGKLLNADLNGALNILRKSNVVSLRALYASGDVVAPIRIRIA